MSSVPAAGNSLTPAQLVPYGFVTDIFTAQNALPRVVKAEQRLIDAIALQGPGLSQRQKGRLWGVVASAWGGAIDRITVSEESESDSAFFAFAQKLTRYAQSFCGNDVESLRSVGFVDSTILNTLQTIALGQLLCTLARGLCQGADWKPPSVSLSDFPSVPASLQSVETRPYLEHQASALKNSPISEFFREHFGFFPNVFRDQMLRAEVVEAQTEALSYILIPEHSLNRIQKENILLTISAANANTYFVAVHAEVLSALGQAREQSDRVIEGEYVPTMTAADGVLLTEMRKLALPVAAWPGKFDASLLGTQGFTPVQILEAVTMAALTNFLNTLQFGLGSEPDFPPRRVFTPKDLYPFARLARPTFDGSQSEDADAPIVARVQNGDADAFEDLVRRHSRRVFSTLTGILGSSDDARDATQEVFLKAFEHIDRFQQRSKFSTWLISIAINTGTDLLRQRRPSDSLDEGGEDEGFRPRQIQSWAENPEQVLAASERNELVRQSVLRLPPKYRIAVLLRDINQLSTEEAAAALGVTVSALKARLVRGRLMLREHLAPHFIRGEGEI
jgi:RNA polymerase sigma-70 factor, ECF subfamily